MKRHFLASLLAAAILSPTIASAAPSPSLQGLQTGVWNVISDNDPNPN